MSVKIYKKNWLLPVLSCHNVSEHLVLLQFGAFGNLAHIVTNQVAPVIAFHAEVTLLELLLTLCVDTIYCGSIVQRHHVVHQTADIIICFNVFQH